VCSQKPATGPYHELQDEAVMYELTKHLLQTHSDNGLCYTTK